MLLSRLMFVVMLVAVCHAQPAGKGLATSTSSNGPECAYKCNPLDIKEPLEPKSGSNTAKV